MKTTKHQNINFEKVSLERVNMEVNPGIEFPEGGFPVNFVVEVKHAFKDTRRKLKVSIDVKVKSGTKGVLPIDISITAAGYFSIGKSEPIEILTEFSKIQAPALLFPFVREFIADLTLKAGLPPILLPPANIQLLIGKHKKSIKK